MRKKATSSSDVSYGAANRAVDLNQGSRLRTRVEKNPWMKIDLIEVYFIHDVVILAMVDSVNGPMVDLNIRIGTYRVTYVYTRAE